jgi:RHS repeat-associated protein
VKAGANTIWTAEYSEEGLRTRKTEFRGPDFFDHKYSYGPGGLLWDSHPNHVFTPGWGHRSNGINTFYHSDWLGSTRYTSDITGNSFPQALRTDAFGNRSATGDPANWHPTDFQFGADWGYQTEWASATDPGLGLHYLHNRYYDPAVARFLSPDPSGMAGGLNLYAYCGNNPVGMVDPGGDVPVLLVTGGVGALVGGVIGGASEYFASGGDWNAALAGAGKGALIGGVTGLTGGALAGVGCAALGGSTLASLANAAVAGAVGDLVGQTVEMSLGWRCEYSGWQTFGAAAGGVALQRLASLICFVEGTPVVLADGTTKPIEQVQVGDRVLARDEESGKIEAKRVTQVFERETEATLVLTFANGEQIETTPEHPFYVEGRGFVAAGQLAIGTAIVTRAGPAVKLTQVERKAGAKKVYNFEVEDLHTYFVGKADGGLWVHNRCDPFHHIFPQSMRRYFEGVFDGLEMDIDDFTVQLPEAFHDVTHWPGWWKGGGYWVKEWKRFRAANPNATFEEVWTKAEEMIRDFGFENLDFVRHPKARKR